MPLSDTYQRLPLDSITVLRDERQRRVIHNKDHLKESIQRNGVMQPIIVRLESVQDGTVGCTLVAGERRLHFSRELELPDIPVRFAHDLSPTEAQILELEENIKRSDLDWQDIVRGVSRIHALYRELDAEWTQSETAAACGLSHSAISIYLSVARCDAEDSRIWEAGSILEAYNVIKRRESREMGDALEELLGPSPVLEQPSLPPQVLPSGEVVVQPAIWAPTPVPPTHETILHEDFLQWAPSYSGRKFNFIHCDFPYGINPFSGEQGRGANPDQYEDDPQIYWTLLKCLCDNLPRLMSISSHMMFWYSDKLRDHGDQCPANPTGLGTIEFFRTWAPSLSIHVYPLVWVKSDNAGIAGDSRRHPRHIYETCLLLSHGGRQLVGIKADAYSAPTDHRLHPSCKPEPVLHHFMSMFVDEQSTVLDPTCGSGSALRVAERLNAKHVLGLEKDWSFCETARKALREARLMRQGERAVKGGHSIPAK